MSTIKKTQTPAPKIKILDFVGLYAMGIASYMNKHESNNIEIITQSGDEQLNSLVKDEVCQLVLFHVKIDLPELVITQQIAVIKAVYPNAKIILYSIRYSGYLLSEIFANDINGYFLLSEKPENLMKVIKEVLKDKLSLSQEVVAQYKYKKNMRYLIRVLNQTSSTPALPLHLFAENVKMGYNKETAA